MPRSGDAVELWHHWYEIIENDSLRQGDLFRDLVVPLLPDSLELMNADEIRPETSIDLQWKKGTWILFSASCDLEAEHSVPFALLGLVVPLDDILGSGKTRNRRQRGEIVRRGLMPSKFRLVENPEASPAFADSVVDYRVHVTVPVPFLRRACIGPRLRLKPPFREQFGSWVGWNISRVGIENEMQIERDTAGVSDARLLEMVEAEEGASPNN